MTDRPVLVEVGPRRAWLPDTPRNLLDQLRIPHEFDPACGVWTIALSYVDDVIRAVEARGRPVEIREVER